MGAVMKTIRLVCFLLLIQAVPALAAPYLTVSLNGGLANTSSQSGTIPSRTLVGSSLEGVLGVSWKFLIVGVAADVGLLRQTTDPAQVFGSNTQGNLFTVSPVLGAQHGSFRLLARFPLAFAKYNLDRTDLSGQSVAYSDAAILDVQLHWLLSKHFFLGLEYQQLTFKQMQLGGTASNLSGADSLILRNYSLLAGLSLF